MSERELFPDEDPEDSVSSATPAELPADVPEADAVGQAMPVVDDGNDLPTEVSDRPEADALDQERAAIDPEEPDRI